MGIKDQATIKQILNQRIGQKFELIAHAGSKRNMAVQATGILGTGARGRTSTGTTWTLKFDSGIIIFDESKVTMIGGVGQSVIRLEVE